MDGTDGHLAARTQQGLAFLGPCCSRSLSNRNSSTLRGSRCHSFSEFERIVCVIVKGQSSLPQSNRIPLSQLEGPFSKSKENGKRERDTSSCPVWDQESVKSLCCHPAYPNHPPPFLLCHRAQDPAWKIKRETPGCGEAPRQESGKGTQSFSL